MTYALLVIGTELTRGELHDTNSAYLAEQLTSLGHEVTEFCCVDDDEARIVAALLRLSHIHQIVLCTGGLGPTTDDKTSACVAAALGVPLERNSVAHRDLQRLMRDRGRTLTPASEKQADFPRGALLLPNDHGSAPGFTVTKGECRLFFMPGVPAEMRPMFEHHVAPRLPPAPRPTACRRLRTFGMPEVEVNDLLAGVEKNFDLTLGYRASHSEIEVKILASGRPGESKPALEARAEAALVEVRSRLGDIVYAEGTSPLPEAIGLLLRARRMTFALAESCTGGLVSQLVTSVPGASEYYLGGVCSYSNQVKTRLLHVSPEALTQFGAVSEPAAIQMAEGARKLFESDLALSVTGIAGPSGGSADKPVGLVHWAVSSSEGTECFHKVFHGSRSEVQQRAALSGLWSVRQVLLRSR